MNIYNNITDTIGNTPIVRLKKVVGEIKPSILAKLEFLNPGGSVKDRMAIFILKEAEKKGYLKPGGLIVENTSGNTGVAIAMYAAEKGYRTVFTIPDKMSQEKIDRLKAYGSEVIICPTNVPPDAPESYYQTAKSIAEERGGFLVNQYHNPANIEAHYKTTGPEIWKQTNGKMDYFIAGCGTGGTISGVGRFLKEKNPDIKIIGVDPVGSVYYDYFKHKKLIEPQVYKVEGIGEDMLCSSMDFSVIDDIIQVSDRDAFLMTRRLAKEEGIFAGGSSGAAVWASIEVAKKIDKDAIIVVILPDTGFNYLTKIYNDDWMRENGFI